MTLGVEASDREALHAEQVDDHRARRRRRIGRWVLAVAGVAAVAAIAVGAWWITVQSALAGVSVAYDTEPIVCEGAEVGTRSADVSDFRTPLVALTEGMECRLRIHVLNSGWADVEIREVTLKMMGEGNALALVPRFVDPNAQSSSLDEDGGVVFTLDPTLTVARGGSQLLEAVIGYDGGALLSPCTGSGWNLPVVTVAAAGMSAAKAPPEADVVWFQNGTPEDCGETG